MKLSPVSELLINVVPAAYTTVGSPGLNSMSLNDPAEVNTQLTPALIDLYIPRLVAAKRMFEFVG